MKSVFVGREPELAALGAALEAAARGVGAPLLVVGEAGIGKSRLAEEMTGRAAAAGFRTAWGRCWEAGGAPAFWPWVQVMRSMVRSHAKIARSVIPPTSALSRLVPELSTGDPPAAQSQSADLGHESEADRFFLFDAFVQWLRGVSLDQPLLIVIDDLHAADEASLLLLRFLAREIATMPVVVVATSRSAEARQRPEVAEALSVVSRDSSRVDLHGLSHEEIHALVANLLGVAPDTEVLSRIERATEGNPFFIGEAVRVLGTEDPSGTRALGSAAPVSDTVLTMIRRRLESLEPQTREVLEAASLIGKRFDRATAAKLTGLGESEVEAILRGAVDAEVIDPAGEGYRFVHSLVRDTALNEIHPERRSALHRRLAHLLVAGPDSEQRLSEAVNHHLAAGLCGEEREFSSVALRWADRCMAMLAYEEAARLTARAAEVLDGIAGAEADRAAALLCLGEACWYLSREEDMRRAFSQAAKIGREIGDTSVIARAALGYAKSRMEAGIVHQDLIVRLEAALAVRTQADDRLRARLLTRLAEAQYFTKDRERGVALNAEAVEIARRRGDPDLLVATLSDRRFVLWGPGRLDERLAVSAEACDLSAGLERDEFAIRAQMWRICDLLELGDIAAVDREIEIYTRRCTRLGFPGFIWHAQMLRAMRAIMEGRFDDGERLAAKALSGPLATYAPAAAQFYSVQTYLIARERGALRPLEETVRGFVDDYPNLPIWRSGLALIYLETARPAEARRELDVLARDRFSTIPTDGNWLPTMANIAEVVAGLDDADLAATACQMLEPFARQNIVIALGAACVGSTSRFLGLLEIARGRYSEALGRFEAAIETDSQMGGAPSTLRSKLGLARALASRGEGPDRARAIDLIRGARLASEALGMSAVVGDLSALGDSIESPLPVAPPTPSAATTVTTNDRAGPVVFRRQGGMWLIGRTEAPLHLRHSKGLAYIAELLRVPGQEVHAIELAGSDRPDNRRGNRAPPLAQTTHSLGDAGELLDARAIGVYRNRLTELGAEIGQAEANNDLGRLQLCREERESLLAELTTGVGLAGRRRRSASHAERARQAVTKALKAAILKISAADQALGHHLRSSIHTGAFCSYDPDPTKPLRWALD